MIGMITLLLALLARIHGDGPAPSAPAPAPAPSMAPPAGILAGPAATAPAAAPTIVERSFDGALAPLDDEPEVVATFRLALSEDQRPRLEAAAAARSAAFEQILLANYDEFLRMGEDLKSMRSAPPAERGAALARMREVRATLTPFEARGTFLEEAAPLLEAEQLAQARRMAEEWRAARRAELSKEVFSKDTAELAPAEAERLDARLRLELLGQLAKRTIQRRADSRTAQFDAVVRQLDLTPEQAERVKQLFMEIAVQEIQGKRERGQLTRREREHVFGELAKILDGTQRGKLRELLLGDRGSAGR